MRVLIAYDGSECSNAAILDLQRAGLPSVSEVLVLSVAEISHQITAVPYAAAAAGPGMFFPASLESEEPNDHQLEEVKACSAQAAERLRSDFPGWHVDTETWLDAAGPAIIRTADAWKPDLVVLGSHGRSGISRLVHGSVSQNVLHHVTSSVRISRHRLHSQKRPIRLLIGVDGSLNANFAVQAIAVRDWPVDTEACVIGVLDSRISIAAAQTLEGAIPAAIEDESRSQITRTLEEAVHSLEKRGLRTTHKVLTGIPSEMLLAEAEKWSADCLFVGARGFNRFKRFLLGSVSTEVASRARCSVEIVKKNWANPGDFISQTNADGQKQ